MTAVMVAQTGFLGGADSQVVSAPVSASVAVRQVYEEELAGQLGIPFITSTPVPTRTPAPTVIISTPTPITATVDQDILVVSGPSQQYLDSPVGSLLINQVVNVVGRSPGLTWIQIELYEQPGVLGWVPLELVTLEGGTVYDLPIVDTSGD